MKKTVFLCYAKSDTRKAMRLYKALIDLPGIECWIDSEDLRAGVEWGPAIHMAIRKTDYFIALLSKKSVTRGGFRNTELRHALEERKKFPPSRNYLIPARLDNCAMPFSELEPIHFVNLFPSWAEGVEQIRQALEVPAPKSSKAKKQRSPRQRTGGLLDYQYRVGLADIDVGLTNVRQIAQALNSVQAFFHFTLADFKKPSRAYALMDGTKHLRIEKLPKSFFRAFEHTTADYVLCMTRHLLSLEKGAYICSGYLSAETKVDDRFFFLSTHRLNEYSKKAGVNFELGLVFSIVAQIIWYFTKVGYHKEIRGCPMDWTDFHKDRVKGINAGRFCLKCQERLLRSAKLYKSVCAMLRWGTKGRRPSTPRARP